jgi:hypothetical protein
MGYKCKKPIQERGLKRLKTLNHQPPVNFERQAALKIQQKQGRIMVRDVCWLERRPPVEN